ncbi:unnamed protein product [Auanema sp. JU1783]|nr:unnamed protein product [Auanema sp. JU1783]
MFPVRVAVETVRTQNCLTCASDGHILIDTYAIVSGTTLLNQLVDTVLSALGHPQLAVNAKGLVQVNNWKALPFDQITDNLDDTVHSLFKDIANQITLRILTKQTSSDSASQQCINDLKQRLLRTAISKNPNILNTVENQQIKDIITQIIAGDDPTMLNHDQINAINDWIETIDLADERRSPVSQVRFNSFHEVPRLEKWFKADPNPSRPKLVNYMNTLNNSSYRKNHPKIGYQQICNWFQNQRANKRNGFSQQTQISQIQASLPAILADYRPKIDFSNLIDSCQKSTDENISTADWKDILRVDGGSDSPSPGDDEIHSNSDGANEFKQESTASSPDLSLHIGSNSLAGSSPRHGTENFGSIQTASSTTASSNTNNSLGIGSQSRSRLMFDPLTELPILEKWFEDNPHPTWMQIDQYTQMLNNCPYRENYPHISQHNVKIWFKNRRAKCKRMQSGMEKIEKVFS